MGQGGSISENKSFILSNWVQTKPNSNIFYNKVTNQQIERHEVLINDKHQLSSYNARMHDQSLLICRLIYFHPKSTPKDDAGKKHHAKQPSNELIQQSNRAKPMLKQPSQLHIQHKSSPKNFPSTSSQHPKIYCVYTDRMIPVKQWNKDKIIDVIEAFKKLTQVYGFFKVREGCICENERKEVKIWISDNPVSNFVLETVDTEEDMIADLAAILVSKKEKIAKELLDLQYFAQVIEHFSKLNDFDMKKYHTSSAPNPSARGPGFPASNRQSQTSQPSFTPPEVNNFYNVFINTENSYRVSSSLQNSKYNLINKGSFGYPYYAQTGEGRVPPNSKETEREESGKREAEKGVNMPQFKADNDVKVKRQCSPTECGFPNANLALGSGPSNSSVQMVEEKELAKNLNQPSQSSSINHVSYTTIGTKDSVKKVNQQTTHPVQTFGQRDLTQNTSIMINTKKDTTLPKNGSVDKEKDRQNANRQHNLHIKYMANSQKKTPPSVNAQNPNLYSTQAPKSTVLPKFIPSTQQQIKNRLNNNSNGDIAGKANTPAQNVFALDSFAVIKKEIPNSNSIESTRPMLQQRSFFSNASLEKPGSSLKNYSTLQNNSYAKPGSSFHQKTHQTSKNYPVQNTKQQSSGDTETKSFIRTEYNPTAGQKSKAFIKSFTNDQQKDLLPNYSSTRNVVSQMSTVKPPITMSQNPTLLNTLSKKSFPKYLQEKQSAKSIPKYDAKLLDQREKSRVLIGKVDDKMSPQKVGFEGEGFKYQHHKTQEVVAQVSDSEACSHEMIPPSSWQQAKTTIAQNQPKHPTQTYEPRRKFPSTTQGKPKKLIDMRQFEQMQCKKSKQGTQVDSQQSDNHQKLNLTSHPIPNKDKHQHLKKVPSKGVDESDNKSCIMTKSYFSYMNTNNSLLVGNQQYDKQQFKSKVFATDVKKVRFDPGSKEDAQADGRFRFKNLQHKQHVESHEVSSHGNQSSSGPFSKLDEKQSMNYEEPKSRDSIVQTEQTNARNQSFPYPPNSSLRKTQKQFTFFSPNQKQTGVGNIDQIHPFQVPHTKTRGYTKKQSIKSVDEQQTLPRTTADQRQKRLFKQTRVSQVLIDTEDLHRSDPGHKIQQIVERIQKQKQALMKKNGQQQLVDEKLDVKQYPVFKKWQPSMNVFGSVINQHSYNSCAKKKEYAKSEQQGAQDKLSMQDSQKDQKACPSMINSQNLQTKKKIRKQVFMDYKGLFGDDNPFQKEETAEDRQRARRLQVKRQREEEERLLENASGKDLLIQEKVQKQKEKHAQLKNDLSKLFTEES